MTNSLPALWWNNYKKYVRGVLLPPNTGSAKDITYWRNDVFCNILLYTVPLSIIALIPCVPMAFLNGIPIVGVADLLAFVGLTLIMTNRNLSLVWRKIIFTGIIYSLSVLLIYNRVTSGPGLLFLLTITILSAIIYSSSSAIYSAWVNTVICAVFGMAIYLRLKWPMVTDYDLGTWVAISSNLVVVSFVCTQCLKLLLEGLEKTMSDKLVAEKEFSQTNLQLQFNKNNLRSLINNTTDLMWSVDRQFKLITSNEPLNEMMRTLTGKELKEGVNMLTFASSWEQADRFKSYYERAFKGEIFTEIEHTDTPEESWAEISYYPIRKEDKIVGTACHSRDITALKKTEKAMQELANRLVMATHSANIGIWNWDLKRQHLAWDEIMFRIYNIDSSRLGSVYDGWLARLHPEDKDHINAEIQLALTGAKDYNTEFRIVWDDLSVHYIRVTGAIERDEDGKPVRMIGTNWDVTESRNSEKLIRYLNENLEKRINERTAELYEANKELEAFNYTVSHDLKNPLRSINAFTKILLNRYHDKIDSDGIEFLKLIQQGSKHMDNLVQELLTFSKLNKTTTNLQQVNMNEMVDGVLRDVKAGFEGFKADIILSDLPPALCDAVLIWQVWANLIWNAVKYSSQKEKPVIKIGALNINGETVYYVKDNGAGFDMKYADKLFGVFQRLHSREEFEGTGVGLATVQRIIKRHGGRIWAEAKVNEGATFYFTLAKA